ncbi:MAG: ATP synthase F1 subunit epsilon [Bacteroidales bacterium]|jgi:F-type H+-transporting ATPase subunit epsilon|nr:ATP synthase F1 subunit epsilon [Bacteroidales bacterium]
MLLEVITPQKTVFSGEVSLIKVPGSKGSFEILKNHAPVISTLSPGELKFAINDGEVRYYRTGNGVVEIKNNHVIVLVDSLEKITMP